MYNIENSGLDPFDILTHSNDPKAVRCFLENGLSDWYNSSAHLEGLSEYVNLLMSAEGFQLELLTYMQTAVLLALPVRKVGNVHKKETETSGNILSLKTAFVDIMGASEADFMSSTVREASERWERYAEAMGYTKPAQKFSRYDDYDDD